LHVQLRLQSLGVSTRPPVVPTAVACPRGYRHVVVKYGNDDFVIYLGDSGEDADAALAGSPAGALTLDRRRASSEHLKITRTFHPPDNFNLLFLRLVVHGPPSVTVVVDSAQDPHRETVSFTFVLCGI